MKAPFPDMQLKQVRVVIESGSAICRFVTIASEDGKQFGARIEDLVGTPNLSAAPQGTIFYVVQSRDLTMDEITRIKVTNDLDVPFEIDLRTVGNTQ